MHRMRDIRIELERILLRNAPHRIPAPKPTPSPPDGTSSQSPPPPAPAETTPPEPYAPDPLPVHTTHPSAAWPSPAPRSRATPPPSAQDRYSPCASPDSTDRSPAHTWPAASRSPESSPVEQPASADSPAHRPTPERSTAEYWSQRLPGHESAARTAPGSTHRRYCSSCDSRSGAREPASPAQ